MEPLRIRDLLKRWGARSALSIVDQGVLSGSNFIFSLLLARWLTPGEYGGYAVVFSIFLFASGFHNALILEPLYVLGSSRRNAEARGYLGTIVWLHGGLAVIMSTALAGAAAVFTAFHSPLAGSMLSLAIAAPFILLFWLFRGACYVQTRPGLALRGSLAYGILLLGALFLVARAGHASAFAAFLCMALAGCAGVALLVLSLGMRGKDFAWSAARVQLKTVMAENWRYGRWVTGSAVVFWLNGALYLPLVGMFGGLAQAGAFQALQNVLRPMQQSGTALSSLFLPHVSRQMTAPGNDHFQRTVGRVIAVNVAFSAAWLIVVLFARDWIVGFLYRRAYYSGFTALLPLLWVAALLWGVTQGLAVGLKSVRRSDRVFWVQLFAAIATVAFGLVSVRLLKIQGAALGSVLSALLAAAGSLLALMPYLRGKNQSGESLPR